MAIKIKVDGTDHEVDVDGDMPLLWVLRDVLGMTGTKFGCGIAQCGACTVHLDGQPDPLLHRCRSAASAIGRSPPSRRSARRPPAQKIQKAWLDLEVVQCGYCQSGQIMSAAALLASNPNPSDADIDAAMSGNICRCGTYVRIREAIKQRGRVRRTSIQKGLIMLLEMISPKRRCPPSRREGRPLAPLSYRRGRRRRRSLARLSACRLGLTRRKPPSSCRASRRTPSSASAVTGCVTVIMPAGRDGPGHLHLDADADRRGVGDRPGAGARRAFAARATSSTAIR